MLHWKNRRVSPDGVGTGHIAYGVKRVWKGSFQDHNVLYLRCIMRRSHWGWLHLWAAENGLGNARGGNCQSGVPNGLRSRGIRHLGWRNGPGKHRIAYLDFHCSAGGPEMVGFYCIFSADGLGMAGSQCLFTLAENSGLPLATAVVLGVAACVEPLYLTYRVLKGDLFGSLPLATGGLDCYLVYGMCGCQIRNLKLNNTQPLWSRIGEEVRWISGIFKYIKPYWICSRFFSMSFFSNKVA